MMNDIADSKTAAIKAKIDKVRGEEAAGAGTPKSGAGTKAQQGKNGGGKKVQTSGDKKRQEKAKALVRTVSLHALQTVLLQADTRY
jgi:hypothetical protein